MEVTKNDSDNISASHISSKQGNRPITPFTSDKPISLCRDIGPLVRHPMHVVVHKGRHAAHLIGVGIEARRREVKRLEPGPAHGIVHKGRHAAHLDGYRFEVTI
jgi:hypothetical protein